MINFKLLTKEQIREIREEEKALWKADAEGETVLWCDRDICFQNMYTDTGCEDCIVTKNHREVLERRLEDGR